MKKLCFLQEEISENGWRGIARRLREFKANVSRKFFLKEFQRIVNR